MGDVVALSTFTCTLLHDNIRQLGPNATLKAAVLSSIIGLFGLSQDETVIPTSIQLGALRLPAYATLLSLGLIGGLLLALWQGRRDGLAPIRSFDAVLLGAGGGLVGARVTYVTLNWAYFRDHLAEAMRLSAGGLAWYGGLMSGLLLVAVYGLRFRPSLGALADALTPALAWFTLFVWLGSAVAHDVYGRETFPLDGLLWRLSADLPDLYGLYAPRINVSLLGILWSGSVLAVLCLLRARRHPSRGAFLLFLALTGLGGLLLVPLQANPVPFLFRVRLDWLFNLLLLVAGLGGLMSVKARHWIVQHR
jgi:phosphatidylglycerol:prolipoprotein diacylglycerol transferase